MDEIIYTRDNRFDYVFSKYKKSIQKFKYLLNYPKFKKMSPDIELGKRLKKEGPIAFNPKIKVRSSFRRYQESGVASTQWMFFKAWWAMLRGHEPSISYEEYNS